MAFPGMLKGRRQASSEGRKELLIRPQFLLGEPLP